MSDSTAKRRSARAVVAWLVTVVVLLGYLSLPSPPDPRDIPVAGLDASDEPARIEVLSVSPGDVVPGSAIVVHVAGGGAEQAEKLKVFAGRVELAVIGHQKGAVVARLPAQISPGRVKIRVADGEHRSKPYDLQVEAPNWHKPYRNLVGGIALLLFGIGIFGGGAREAVGLESARVLTRIARRRITALGFGTMLGALVQSTTAAAGLLAGLVNSSLLATLPAAAAFLGAGLGAATAPLVTGLFDAREGLLAVALGVLWSELASDRRARAVGKLVLGAGMLSFGLHLLRQGFEPFVSNPTLLPVVDSLRADGVLGLVTCALLGAALVAALQGPAPVLVLVIGFAEATGHWDLRTALAVLSGSGFGAAVGALLTTPTGRRSRRLAQLNLLVGFLASLIALASVDLWVWVADAVVSGTPSEVTWGERVLLPNLGRHLAVGFACSGIVTAGALLPLLPGLSRVLDRIAPDGVRAELAQAGDAAGVLRAGLLATLRKFEGVLPLLGELARFGDRRAGRNAEHRLADARAGLEDLLAGPARALPPTAEGGRLNRAIFAQLQLLRSLEALLNQAERLVHGRISHASSGGEPSPLSAGDDATLREMQELLVEGLSAQAAALEARAPADLEASRAREIRMNGLESRARTALLSGPHESIANHLAVLELVDAYEACGNQLYRLAEALGETHETRGFARVV
jgi:hypothetical protein